MFHNCPSFCLKKLSNRNSGYLAFVKTKEKGVVTNYNFSRCRDHVIKSNGAFLKTEISEDVNENVHILWHINKKQENVNPFVCKNFSEKIPHVMPYGEKGGVEIEKGSKLCELRFATKNIVKNVDILGEKEISDIKLKDLRYNSSYVEEAIPSKEIGITASEKEKKNKTFHKKGVIIYVKKHLKIYCELSKWKLTLWVTLSSCFGQFMLGYPSFLGISSLLTGVFLCSCSANTFNQIVERDLDKLMIRTKKRPLPTKQITLKHAKLYGFTTALAGTLTLFYYNNLLTAALGLFNIILYTCVYTPLKIKTPYNTHIGSVVGSIPTLMGCTSMMPTLFLPEPWILFVTQLLWQFPHFYSLAYLYKEDYLKGNYKMFPLKDTNGMYTVKLCKPYIVALTLLPFFFFSMGYTSYEYVFSSLLPNMFIYYKFYKISKAPSRRNVRSFFKHSLWHIILLLALSAYHTKMSAMGEQVTEQMGTDRRKESENCEDMRGQDTNKSQKKTLNYYIVLL